MSWRKYLLIPQLTLYSVRAPRDQAAAWERFWSGGWETRTCTSVACCTWCRARRPDVVRTIEALLGGRGTAYVSETDQAGDPLETLERQGATATALPAPVRRLITAGVRPPTHFGSAQVAEHFPPGRFRVLSRGPVTMYGIPLRPGGPVHEIPGYHAVVRRVG
jgi:hypothetical protein